MTHSSASSGTAVRAILRKRFGGIERRIQVRSGPDQELEPAALLAHAFERKVDDPGGEQREDDPDASDRSEHRRDIRIDQGREEGKQRRERRRASNLPRG